jgi:cytochrome b561
MNPRVPTEGYGPTPKLLHWVTVVLVALVWMLGRFGDELSEGSARDTGLFAHISIGLAILVLARGPGSLAYCKSTAENRGKRNSAVG